MPKTAVGLFEGPDLVDESTGAGGYWRCDHTLIKHPERTITIHHGNIELPSMEPAREYALHDALAAVDQHAMVDACTDLKA